jgi:hypothetical protein
MRYMNIPQPNKEKNWKMSTCNPLVSETQRISADYAQKNSLDTLDYTLASAPWLHTAPGCCSSRAQVTDFFMLNKAYRGTHALVG